MDIEKILCSPELIDALENAWNYLFGVLLMGGMTLLRMFHRWTNEQPWYTKRMITWGLSIALPQIGSALGIADLTLTESGITSVIMALTNEVAWNKGAKPLLVKFNRYNADANNRLTVRKNGISTQK